MNKTPASISVIGWIYSVIGMILIAFGILLLLGLGFLSTLASSLFSVSLIGAIGFLLFGFLGIISLFLGQGVLRKNKVSWYLLFIFAALGMINILFQRKTASVVGFFWDIFVIWKLWEHRKLFGI